MATLLQSIGFFKDLFDFFLPFLLVFSVVYAILVKTKFLTEDANVNALVALAISLVVVLSRAGEFLMQLTPFMATFFIILFFVLMLFLFFGVDLSKAMQSKAVIVLIIVISAIFVFYVLGNFLSPEAQMATAATSNVSGNVTVTASPDVFVASEKTCDFSAISGGHAVVCIISNPKFLGAITVLGLLAIVTFFVVYKP
ncbi:MAG: hypothetical protein J7K73_03650 [Nanoarchaeota archaeon]|nr:hypothetical protein [Nanoarchaeota archaeon]